MCRKAMIALSSRVDKPCTWPQSHTPRPGDINSIYSLLQRSVMIVRSCEDAIKRMNNTMTPNAISQPAEGSPLVAAIDLGSNSFHMIVARKDHGELRPVERLGEKVQLAAGLDENNNISSEAMDRGLDCLRRFAQYCQNMPRGSVRIVGTNTLRRAKNSALFIEKAQEILDHPIDIIAGREEARLIYLGVAHTQSDDNERRLVVDIGGRQHRVHHR